MAAEIPDASPQKVSCGSTERRAISTKQAPAAIGPYSQAIECGNLLFASGQIPIDPGTGTIVDGGTAAQTEQVMQNLSAVLAAAGMSFGHVVKMTVYLKDLSDFEAMNAVYGRFVVAPLPARATLQAARLPRDVRVEIDLIAAR
jgi:2-iminobutanoate/2-iminopropanoate deaminase